MLKKIIIVVVALGIFGIAAFAMYKAIHLTVSKQNQESSIIHATNASFDEHVLSAKGLVLVEFWAEWCGACRMISPILNEVGGEMGDALKIVKVNVDKHNKPGKMYDVKSLPSLLLFKDGKLVDTIAGALPKESLIQWIKANS